MQASPEIREAALQALRDQLAGNLDAALQAMSQEPGFLSIGTAPAEWFSGFAAFEQAARAATAAGGGGMPPLENVEVEAYQEGTVGWGSERGTLRLPNGVALSIRGTFVVHQEGGRWKAVQTHTSVGIPDDQIMNMK
ncbi:MAG TPA: nuclear transport factor 2 family protein [Ktedonobacterales bacterium]